MNRRDFFRSILRVAGGTAVGVWVASKMLPDAPPFKGMTATEARMSILPPLYIHSNCENLIRELTMARYNIDGKDIV